MIRTYLVAFAVLVTACGEDEGNAPPPPKPASAPAKAAAGKNGPKGKELKPMRRIEDRVGCPTPSDAKKCDPKASKCDANEYCLAAGKDHYCGPCPERDAIRHVFKPRDFQGVDVRDPFQSFVISQPGLGTTPDSGTPKDTTPKCLRKDQFVAASFGYQTLRLVGISSQGTQRKALMMGNNLGYIVKKGDCVGKEKAVVKDIGAGFITFQLESVGKGDASEYSMQLYPTRVSMSSPDAIDPGAAGPVVAPPDGIITLPPPPQDQTIIEGKPAPSAPTQIKP